MSAQKEKNHSIAPAGKPAGPLRLYQVPVFCQPGLDIGESTRGRLADALEGASREALSYDSFLPARVKVPCPDPSVLRSSSNTPASHSPGSSLAFKLAPPHPVSHSSTFTCPRAHISRLYTRTPAPALPPAPVSPLARLHTHHHLAIQALNLHMRPPHGKTVDSLTKIYLALQARSTVPECT